MYNNFLRFFFIVLISTSLLCSPERVRRVIGGYPVQNSRWPFLIAVYYNGVYECMFSLISLKSAIGPASCLIDKNVLSFHGRIGNVDRYKGTKIFFKNYVIHKSYKCSSEEDNIALLFLKKPITISSTIMPAALPHKTLNLTETWRGVYSAGWGCSQFNRPCTSSILQEIYLHLIRLNSYCLVKNYVISDKELCLFRWRKSTALGSGDLGAPLMGELTDYHRKTLLGISSHTFDNSTRFEIFTSIKVYYDWIIENSEGNLSFLL
ncbi:serine protease ami-like [Centruroides sculpturatus]|uniref:serine protease ami-like n=1 Tax=Centruroides sculpturatus TaxID=218467 RepID=UPI000C6D48C6|nr:serine protease ami-like [Centruroides sculpturatus]